MNKKPTTIGIDMGLENGDMCVIIDNTKRGRHCFAQS